MRKHIFKIIIIVIVATIVANIGGIILVKYNSPSEQINRLLKSFDQKIEEIDKSAKSMTPERIDPNKCPYSIPNPKSAECLIYQLENKKMILVNGYQKQVNLYVYDLDNDDTPEILKWDLDQDKKDDVLEYDIDRDGTFQHARADMNFDGKFDDNEIYVLNVKWNGLFPGALPFPVLPVFPY